MHVNDFQRRHWGQPIPGVAVNLQPILTLFGLLYRPGEVIELRLADPRSGHLLANGYFNDPGKLVLAVQGQQAKGVCQVAVNPVRRDLLTAASNKLRWPAGWTATERDVTRRCLLPVRFRAVNGNHLAARDAALGCCEILGAEGWPQPAVAVIDDAIVLLYPINLPNNAETTTLVERVLGGLPRRFSTDLVQVDASAFRAALVLPLAGTLTLPETLVPVSYALLERLPLPPIQATPEFAPPSASGAGQEPALLDGNHPSEPVAEYDEALDVVAVTGAAVDDGVHPFVWRGCVLDASAWTPTGTLYTPYVASCQRGGYQALSASQFARHLMRDFGLVPDRRKVSGKVIRGLWGIRLRPDGMEGW